MSHPPPCRCLIAIAMLLIAASVSFAQEPANVRKVVLPSLDPQVAARLRALDRRLTSIASPDLAAGLAGQLALPGSGLDVFTPLLADPRHREIWEQLPGDYLRMIQDSGDALVTLPDSAPRLGVAWPSAQVRRSCQERLLALPRASLEAYRLRVDAEAKALLERGRQERSPLPLRRLVDELLCSRHSAAALDLLGDLAFERGHFEEARHWWRRIDSADPFHEPTVDLVRVEAKQVLALIFAGRIDEAKVEIERFIDRHPGARGDLAGQNDIYGTILEKTLAAVARERIVNNDEPWTTFGGDATRNRTLSQALHWSLWEDGPAWRVPLPTLTAKGKDPLPDRGSLIRRAAFHPIIVKDQVLIADHRSVVSYHLTTGKELFRYDLKTAGPADPGPALDAAVAMPRFTLSADRERAYARLGAIGIGPKLNGASWLVCLDLTEPGKTKKRELWRVEAKADDQASAYFEGAPLVCAGRVYAALSKVTRWRVVTSIVCYDTLGRRRWEREVCDCPEFEDNAHGPRHRQHLLTWAGGQVVYASHAGALVAVDSLTGQPTWAVRYPSRGPLTAEFEPSPRDLAPCLVADGCVFAAPLDSERVFCIDAVSGQVRWELEAAEIVHLLGAAHGRLFAATRNGVLAIHTATGLVDWMQPSDGRLPSLGRGLIAGRWLFWPTQDPNLPYRAVTLTTGRQQQTTRSLLPEPEAFDPTMLSTLPPGNLALGHGCLAIAGLRELVVYVPAHRQLPPGDLKPQARLDKLYQQARRLASAGQVEEATKSYRELLTATKARPDEVAWHTVIGDRLAALATDAKPTISKKGNQGPKPSPAKQSKLVAAPRGIDSPRLPLVQAWSHDGGRMWRTDDREGWVFCTQSGHLACRSLADGSLHWRRPLDFEATWLGRWRDLVILSGADAAQALHVDDGRRVWTFAAPSRAWRLCSVQGGVPRIIHGGAGFHHAEQWDDTLLLVDDQRRFFRLRLDSGEVMWQYEPPAAALRPLGAAAFEPHFGRAGSGLFVQSVNGQPYRLDDKLTPLGVPMRPWIQPPLVVGKHVIRVGENGRIIAQELTPPHEVIWSWDATWPTSLTGELCRLIVQDPVLLATAPRNEGSDWIRLDPERGKLLWTIPARQMPDGLAAESVCIGDTAFFYAHQRNLYARSLNHGALQWTHPLPAQSSRWRIRYTKDYLAVYPAEAAKDEGFVVHFIDPWSGSLLQRLTFPEARGSADVVLTPQRVVVSAGGRIYGFRGLDAE